MTEIIRILGLDIGTRRIGVALSDEMGWSGIPLDTVDVPKKGDGHIAKIVTLCRKHSVSLLVVGLPLNMDGSEGRMVVKVRKVAAALSAATGLEVVEWDERLTSVAVERVLREANMDRREHKKVIDKLSASLILQGYLERRRNLAAGA